MRYLFTARVVAEGCGQREETAFGHGGETQGFQFRGGQMSCQTVGFAKRLHQVSDDLDYYFTATRDDNYSRRFRI